jgi:hypothetical protein
LARRRFQDLSSGKVRRALISRPDPQLQVIPPPQGGEGWFAGLQSSLADSLAPTRPARPSTRCSSSSRRTARCGRYNADLLLVNGHPLADGALRRVTGVMLRGTMIRRFRCAFRDLTIGSSAVAEVRDALISTLRDAAMSSGHVVLRSCHLSSVVSPSTVCNA